MYFGRANHCNMILYHQIRNEFEHHFTTCGHNIHWTTIVTRHSYLLDTLDKLTALLSLFSTKQHYDVMNFLLYRNSATMVRHKAVCTTVIYELSTNNLVKLLRTIIKQEHCFALVFPVAVIQSIFMHVFYVIT